ncbi:hypothetical protein [Alysiella filiformis]|uniref:Uncharacterized protein n=1 Tax=Alysiella filiformis DSM 16848 TaxID=1120981 RepID=A0A286ECF3_9NEIS|nr:hypothetical protein [Alysiella filiformis]QMT30562.1 hypothetical protein H3L97_07320 [Alysiella filiformis]UBQ56458.1 hypothetical protein JF568_01360 [Alysiella filiformis DSM 16848]SOD68601.1 hypothetical protein SAMN02746062_01332 [Alysiella filiformis DSM 16848]
MKNTLKFKTLSALVLGAALSVAHAAPVPLMQGLGKSGGATSHGDTLSSDTSPLRGPANSSRAPQLISLSAACPNLMVMSDGKVMAMCVDYITRDPKLTLLDKDGNVLTHIMLKSASLLGSVYAYANERDEVIFVDGHHNLISVRAQNQNGKWVLHKNFFGNIPLAKAVIGHCKKSGCDSVVAINPGSEADDVWFVTQNGVVGVANRKTKKVIHTKIANGETIANSFSTASNNRAAVATTHALYMLDKSNGKINVQWRQAYDRGIARKPGQLSWGTGSTPTFFGTNATQDEFVTITDNGKQMNLLVYAADKSGKQICKTPLFGSNNSGTEDSSIAYGRAIVTSSTYGYPYPKYPDGAGKSIPEKAPFIGGITRVDVKPDNSGCVTKWTSDLRSAALPKLSVPDNLIYTIERTGPSDNATALDSYHFVTLDWNTGALRTKKFWSFGLLSNPLQTVGNIGLDHSYWQGTMNGIIRVLP